MSDCVYCQPQESELITDLRGRVAQHILAQDRAARMAEAMSLREGSLIYHYFEGSRTPDGHPGMPLWKVIYMERRVGSRVRCLPVEEILRSVAEASEKVKPHYGDGAYCTLHGDYPNAHPEVVYAHGIDPNSCRYRAVLVMSRPSCFRKFAATGGVVRSIPQTERLKRDELVTIGDDTGEARLLRIEVFEDGAWRRVAPPLEDETDGDRDGTNPNGA